VIRYLPSLGLQGSHLRAFIAECNNFSIQAVIKAPEGYHEATSISHATETGCKCSLFFIALNMAFKLFVPDRARIYSTIAVPE
jgi:hypothetical protein